MPDININEITKISVRFIYNKTTTITYNASTSSFPKAFDSKNTTVIYGPKNQKWLHLITMTQMDEEEGTEIQSVIIIDYLTNSTILVHDCEFSCVFELISPNTLLSTSKGLFVDGCTKTYSDADLEAIFGEKKKKRKKRSASRLLQINKVLKRSTF